MSEFCTFLPIFLAAYKHSQMWHFDCGVSFRQQVPKYLKSPSSSVPKENLFRMQSFMIQFDKGFILSTYNGKNQAH